MGADVSAKELAGPQRLLSEIRLSGFLQHCTVLGQPSIESQYLHNKGIFLDPILHSLCFFPKAV
jgi:hypothetical protein